MQKDDDGTPLVSWETYMVVTQPIPNATGGGRQRRFVQVRGVRDPVVTPWTVRPAVFLGLCVRLTGPSGCAGEP